MDIGQSCAKWGSFDERGVRHFAGRHGRRCDVGYRLKTVLAVAGADCSAAAGVQADVKTVAAHSAYAVTAIAAVTAQTSRAVVTVEPVSVDLLAAQLRAAFEDFDVAAAKTGMLVDTPRVLAVAEAFEVRRPPHYVLDPVLNATAGQTLLADEAITVMQRRLLPLAELVTPNVPEAERLSGVRIRTLADAAKAARVILDYGCAAVLVKGGHLASSPGVDLLVSAAGEQTLPGEWIPSAATRGTGCTYSAAIAANLANGAALECAVVAAKRYVEGALRAGPAVEGVAAREGRSVERAPMHHGYALRRTSS